MPISIKELQERLEALEGRTFAIDTFYEKLFKAFGDKLAPKLLEEAAEKISSDIQKDLKKDVYGFDSEIERQSFFEKIITLESDFYFDD